MATKTKKQRELDRAKKGFWKMLRKELFGLPAGIYKENSKGTKRNTFLNK